MFYEFLLTVGMSGQVLSFENNPGHMRAARSNYSQWRANWTLTHQTPWPDNVLFLEGSVAEAGSHVTSEVDAVSKKSQKWEGAFNWLHAAWTDLTSSS